MNESPEALDLRAVRSNVICSDCGLQARAMFFLVDEDDPMQARVELPEGWRLARRCTCVLPEPVCGWCAPNRAG